MTDYVGRKLSPGDDVVYIVHKKTSSHFKKSKIKHLTPKMVVMTDGTRKRSDKVLRIRENERI